MANLYRVTFADLSSRDFTASDIGAVYSALGTDTVPITGVQLIRTGIDEVPDAGSQKPQAQNPGPAQPMLFPMYYPPVMPPMPVHDCSCGRPKDRDSVYVNRLPVKAKDDLYRGVIEFRDKEAGAYRADFDALRKGRGAYLFSVPASYSGEDTVETLLGVQSVVFSADMTEACVTILSAWRPAKGAARHQWLTTLRLTVDGVSGSSTDLTAEGLLDVPARYSVRLPLLASDMQAFYPVSGSGSVFPSQWGAKELLSHAPDKRMEDYARDFEAVSRGGCQIAVEIPFADNVLAHDGVSQTVAVDQTVRLADGRIELRFKTSFSGSTGVTEMWQHYVVMAAPSKMDPSDPLLVAHSARIY